MDEISKEIVSVFGNRIRVRVCGICIEDNKILLIKHSSLGPKGILWAPPGGGLQFGESAAFSLIREFKEETGLEIEVIKFLFVHEFLREPLHAVELFFEVKVKNGTLQKGNDPEMKMEHQIIKEVRYISFEEVKKMDKDIIHNIFNLGQTKEELMALKGYFLFT